MLIIQKIQQRYILEQSKELEEFTYGGMNYKVLKPSEKTHLIPFEKLPIAVIMTGFTAQYEVEREDGLKGEAYVYYYTMHEGSRAAILDAIEIKEGSQMSLIKGDTMINIIFRGGEYGAKIETVPQLNQVELANFLDDALIQVKTGEVSENTNKYPWIILTSEGYTQQPDGSDIENCQLIGIGHGKDAIDALKDLIGREKWILETSFNEVFCYKLDPNYSENKFYTTIEDIRTIME